MGTQQDEMVAGFTAAPVRYIKMGRGGSLAGHSLAEGELPLGHHRMPYAIAAAGDRDAIIAEFVRHGRTPGKARDFAREVTDFFHLPQETIWITFANGFLWWAQADGEVIELGEGGTHGFRIRRTLRPWRNTDLNGELLYQDRLSTRLTQVAAYRQTLCSLQPDVESYLKRKLLGVEEPLVRQAMDARRVTLDAVNALIGSLHWADFETLVDLLLARGGWHRVSALGGTMKDADLLVEQTVTGETALVQVKSAASQSVLDDYIGRFDELPALTRLVFVCHSPKGTLDAKARPDVTLWTKDALAEAIIRNGLFDWLVARAA